MKYFMDTEFIERPNSIYLISIGIVGEDGSEYYAINRDFPLRQVWEDKWLRTNVLMSIYNEYRKDKFNYTSMLNVRQSYGKNVEKIKDDILKFVDNKPEFWGYYADYDWVVFCWIFGRMIDLPNGFPMYCKDLKQVMDDKGLDKEWRRINCPDPEGEHNALMDARWNMNLYNQIYKP